MAEVQISSSRENLTNNEIKNRVINIFNDFVSDVDPDQLSDFLIAKRVITIDRWNEIRTERTTQRKCRELLLHLLSITHPTAFLVVQEALEKICLHIWEKIENQPSRITEEAGLRLQFNSRWKEEKEKLVKEMSEERLQWKMEEEALENRIRDLCDELQKWKKEKDVLESRNKELNKELHKLKMEKEVLENHNRVMNEERLQWKKEREVLENCIRERNQELLKWKTEKENPSKHIQGTKSSDMNEEHPPLEMEEIHENQTREINHEVLMRKTEKETQEKRTQATKQTVSVNLSGKFNIPRGDYVQGLTKLNDNIYVLMRDVKSIFVFEDEFPFRLQKEIDIKMIKDADKMTSSNKTKCLYVSDVHVSNNCIWKIKTNDDQVTEWLSNIDGLLRVSVTTDGDLIILRNQRWVIRLEIYDVTDAKQVATLALPEVIHDPLCCIQDPSGDFIISHRAESEFFSPWLISRLTNVGEIKCQFRPLPFQESQKLGYYVKLCNDPDNSRLFVADCYNHRIVLLASKSLIWRHILLGNEVREINVPDTMFYDGKKRQLIVSHYFRKDVSVFALY